MSGGGKYGEVMNKEMKLSSKVRGRSMASPASCAGIIIRD